MRNPASGQGEQYVATNEQLPRIVSRCEAGPRRLLASSSRSQLVMWTAKAANLADNKPSSLQLSPSTWAPAPEAASDSYRYLRLTWVTPVRLEDAAGVVPGIFRIMVLACVLRSSAARS